MHQLTRPIFCLTLLLAPDTAWAQARQQNVVFNGFVSDACILEVRDGELTLSQDFKQMGSEEAGGLSADLLVNSSGMPPQIQFGIPTLTISPTRFVPERVEIAYNSENGFLQTYTSLPTVVDERTWMDHFRVNARIWQPIGFPVGNYQVVTVVTCTVPISG